MWNVTLTFFKSRVYNYEENSDEIYEDYIISIAVWYTVYEKVIDMIALICFIITGRSMLDWSTKCKKFALK